MKNPNVIKLDSKGRILIPIHIRKKLEVEEGTELIVIPDEERQEAKILPLIKDKTAELRFLLTDLPDSLARVANILATHNINILMSESRRLAKGKLAEWRVIVDTSQFDYGIDKLKDEFLNSNRVKSVKIVRK